MEPRAVNVVGAGLAGSEAAFQLARRGVRVQLYEMRPIRMTEAHATDLFGELVCSNSLRSASLETAVGILKEEMRRLGSIVIASAQRACVPAGAALAVDREEFARVLTETLRADPLVEIVRREVTEVPAGITIVATGPLTSPALSAALDRMVGSRNLYFYDAIAPIVTTESIDMNVAFRASRWNKGGEDYINCPLDEQQYRAFVDALIGAEKVAAHPFERMIYFEGCLPIEELARRGPMTLAFGPMRPVGLTDPRTGRSPFAVVQLRQDDRLKRLYNIVGFQTKMTYPEQRRVLRLIPGLEHAEFVRLGSLHRNTFIDSPRLMRPTLQLRSRDDLFLAGQMIGVEGYMESAAAGLLAGINAARMCIGLQGIVPPPETAIGSLIAYITDSKRENFQPMNANFGLMPEIRSRARGRAKKTEFAERALAAMDGWMDDNELGFDDAAQKIAASERA
jgi:methylenetetrahydrofolate--tRNA-(uracil-5-)-methyltransferase